MKRVHHRLYKTGFILQVVVLACSAAMVLTAPAGPRMGGDAEMVYESVSAGGCGFATNTADTMKLGGSLGQGGMMLLLTNASADMLNSGFWKAEDGCTLYPADLTDLTMGTNEVGVTFAVVNSNMYQVLYVTEEEGGLPAGRHAFTNIAVTSFEGEGMAGSSTTVWFNVSGATNLARFYLIQCNTP
jgi:hypothetical protein